MDLIQTLTEIAKRHGIDPQAFITAAKIESGLGTTPDAPGSQYKGLYQVGNDEAQRWGIANRSDPIANAEGTANGWVKEVKPQLEKLLGRTASWPEVYLAHQQGAAGAAYLLKHPDAPAAGGPIALSHVTGNIPGSMRKTVNPATITAGEFANIWLRRFGSGAQSQSQPGQAILSPDQEAANVHSAGLDEIEANVNNATRPGYTAVMPDSPETSFYDTKLIDRLAAEKAAQPSSGVKLGFPTHKPVKNLTEDELAKIDPADPIYAEAQGEIANRKKWNDASFIQNLGDPSYLARQAQDVGGQIGAGIVTAPSILPSLAALPLAAGEFVGRKAGLIPNSAPSPAGDLMQGVEDANQGANDLFNVNSPQDTGQTIQRNLVGVAMPGGLVAKAAGVMLPTLLGDLMSGGKPTPEYQSVLSSVLPQVQAATTGGPPISEPMAVTPDGHNMKADDLAPLLKMGAISLGIAMVPSMAKTLAKGLIPLIRPPTRLIDPKGVRVPPSTTTMDTYADYYKTTTVDANAAMLDQAKRAGIPMPQLAEVTDALDHDTRNAGRLQVDQALTTGKLANAAGQFNVNTAIADVIKAAKSLGDQAYQDFGKYLLHKDSIDTAQANGLSTIRGMALQGHRQQITVLERAYPQFAKISAALADNIDAVRKFAGQGQFAIVDAPTLTTLVTKFRNWVPTWIDARARPTAAEKIAAGLKEPIRSTDDALIPRKEPLPGRQPVGHPLEAVTNVMHQTFMARMQNEAKGMFIDAMRRSPVGRKNFVQVTKDWVDNHPASTGNITTIYRNGEKEYYATSQLMAGTMRFDPLHLISGPVMELFQYPKKLIEFTTTGLGAPLFGFTVAMRDANAGKVTVGSGYKKPTRLGTILAIPVSIGNEAMGAASRAINSSLTMGTDNFFTKVLGPQNAQALSNKLAYYYNKSLNGIIANSGSYSMTRTFDAINEASSVFQRIADGVQNPVLKGVMSGWAHLADSMKGAASYNFLARNIGKATTPAQYRALVKQAKNISGDNTKVGQTYIAGSSSKPQKLSLDPVGNGPISIVAGLGAHVVGPVADGARMIVPWGNTIIQGMANYAKSYWDHPVNFTMRAWQHIAMPAAASYFWNRSLGQDYVDHMMERRSDYQRSMNLYVGIPGAPPEHGVELPLWQEGALLARMMQVGLDHFFRPQRQLDTSQDDFLHAAQTWLGNVVVPPDPSGLSALQATQGTQAPNVVDPPNQLSVSAERVARALGGSLGGALAGMYSAFVEDQGGLIHKIGSGVKEFGYRETAAIPMASNVLGLKPLTGSTQEQGEYYRKADQINEILRFYNFWNTNQGNININPASKAGAKVVGNAGSIPNQYPGVVPPAPTNPLYVEFATMFYTRFGKDEAGFKTLVGRYSDLSQAERTIKNINAGNLPQWEASIKANPTLAEIAKNAGVDLTKPVNRSDANKFLNHYEKVRQDLSRILLANIKSVEGDMSKLVGKPIRIEDLDPYGR